MVQVEAFCQEINLEHRFKWVADAALYTETKLLKQNDYFLINRPSTTVDWIPLAEGEYSYAPFRSTYGGIEQRWLLVFSKAAYDRGKNTLTKKLEREDIALKKALWHLQAQLFGCEQDCFNVVNKLAKQYPLFTIKHCIKAVKKYKKRGQPGVNESKFVAGYQIETTFEQNEAAIKQALDVEGRFILATNDLDVQTCPDQSLLQEYKEQHKVEQGFRFLKDHWFMVDSVFLKSPKRIGALMIVMALCLLVYNLAQYQLREALKKQNLTLPNQVGKEIKTPTIGWIFQLMEGVTLINIYDNSGVLLQVLVSNLNALRQKIISLFSKTACSIYGIPFEIGGM